MSVKFVRETNFLVVDDVSFYSSMTKDHLKLLGFTGEFHYAENVEKAFEMLESNYGTDKQVHFVISDLHMEGENGIDLLKKIRADKKFEKIPFLLLTTDTEAPAIIDAMKEGADEYLFKPWEYEQLKEKVTTCWGSFKKRENT